MYTARRATALEMSSGEAVRILEADVHQINRDQMLLDCATDRVVDICNRHLQQALVFSNASIESNFAGSIRPLTEGLSAPHHCLEATTLFSIERLTQWAL